MASILRGRPQNQWSVHDAALFAATRDFELLKLLSTDKKAFATARRLGGSWAPQQPPTTNTNNVPAAQRATAGGVQDPAANAREGNARQRRSARRAATRRKERQARLKPQSMFWLSVLFVAKLRARYHARFSDRMHLLERAMAAEQSLALSLASSPKRGREDNSCESTSTTAPDLCGNGSSGEALLPRHITPPSGSAKRASRWGPALLQ